MSARPQEARKILAELLTTLAEINAEVCKLRGSPVPTAAFGRLGMETASACSQWQELELDALFKIVLLMHQLDGAITSGADKIQAASEHFRESLTDVTDVSRDLA
jgi:hypothetical protein